jgi:3-oxoacyl-[acyl-carrier-protein] synthase III
MRVRDVFISGLGVFLPEVESTESAVERGLYPAEQLDSRGLTGAAVAGDIPAPEMALRAAQDALKHSGHSADDLALLLYADCWHQGPDGWEPQYYLQHHLVGDDLLAVEIRHGCNGVFSGIELAVGYLRGEAGRKAAMVTASDNFGTPMMKRWDPGTGFILGDGASAIVLSKESGFAQLQSICTATYSLLEEMHRGTDPLFPPGATTGTVVDFEGRLEAFKAKLISEGFGSEVMVINQQRKIDCLKLALTEAEVEPSDIKRVIVNNTSQAEASAYLGVLGFPLSRSTWDFTRGIGHLGASDHMISLHHLLTTGQLEPGDHILMFGVAPGFTYKSAVFKIVDIPSWASTSES